MSLPEAVAVQNELQAKGNEYQKQLEDMQKELQTKAEAYDKAKATMPTAKQEETERELNDMYQKIQQTAQDNQKAFNDEQQRKLGPLLDKVRTAIASVAKAGGYVYIMEKDGGQPLYINDTISKDITVEVKAELAKMLEKAIDELTEKERSVVLFYYYEDLSLKEISKVLEVSESRVSQLHTKAIQKMKKHMGAYMGLLAD